jgi:hypothetical protein
MLARLLGRGACGHLETQCAQLAQQVILINQVCMHHDADPSSNGVTVCRFW